MLNSLALPDDLTPYPHSSVWINGRLAVLDKIVEGTEAARSSFEEETFRFIRAWLSGDQSFDMTTSGSTGPPKSIRLSRSQMLQSALLTAHQIKLQKSTTALLCIDPRYIGGRMMIVRSLVLGLRLLAVEPTANPLIRIPVDRCPQLTALVPYQVQSILESKHPHLLNHLDKVLIGGAQLQPSVREKLQRYQCECYETYGMTETVSHIALRLANTPRKQQYFETLPGVDISLDDRGCLVIAADHLPDTVVTNDIVELVAPGTFEWLGRWDNVINSGGIKISPETVERRLAAIFLQRNFNHRFFIAALPDEKLGNKAVLILEGVHFSSEILQQSLEQLSAELSPYEVPREVYFTETFSSTETQKIDRKQTMSSITLVLTR